MLRLPGEIADGVVLWACPASYVRDVVTREAAGATNPMITSITGTDLRPALHAAVAT
jgi:hypothetical protein